MPAQGTFDTSIKAWLHAMAQAKKIKPGGRLVFINKKTGQAVPTKQASPQDLAGSGIGTAPKIRSVDPVAELRSKGMVLGRKKSGKGNNTRP
jgi:hypothetical protein